jgi:hypothetical protein
MYQTSLEHFLTFVLGHFGLGLIAVTKHHLIKFFCLWLAIDKHLEAPSCIVFVACRSSYRSVEFYVLEKVKMPRVRLYVFLELRT